MSHLGLDMAPDDAPARRRRRSGRLPVIVALLAVLAIVAGAFWGFRSLTSGTADYTGSGTGQVSVVVAKGDSLRAIGQTLADAGVVSSADAFVTAASAEPRAESIAPGTYLLRSQMSGAAAVALMLDPASRQVVKVAVPEGLRVSQWVPLVAKQSGVPAEQLTASLARSTSLGLPGYAHGKPEGFLFPATYDFQPGVGADAIVSSSFARFDQAAAATDLEAAAAAMGRTPLEVITVASIVQVEVAPGDYAKAARVLYNRLAAGMRLQLDSTVNYALGIRELHLSAAQLAVDSPYNTYRVTGLPPGPICSPGQAAIEAALAPAAGPWRYWVTTDPATQTTEFASTYQEFLSLKKKFQSNGG